MMNCIMCPKETRDRLLLYDSLNEPDWNGRLRKFNTCTRLVEHTLGEKEKKKMKIILNGAFNTILFNMLFHYYSIFQL